ncbi:hypothetical protein HPB47_008202 [Ixodes persulcatus]|uniref:Uncharacterized protein n=1 Tax=Ixodes persulcatus TaxID=34615 RepID=A0AC60P5B9_IXOPE|nr:hypothetical protein HPB47_008202 [Ixodes persulcatus]
MAWAAKARVSLISSTISRDRFFLLRNSVKVVDDDDVPEETKKTDAYWKSKKRNIAPQATCLVRPLLSRLRQRCLATSHIEYVSIDEQMIPFHGKTKMRQYVRGKPNPLGGPEAFRVFAAGYMEMHVPCGKDAEARLDGVWDRHEFKGTSWVQAQSRAPAYGSPCGGFESRPRCPQSDGGLLRSRRRVTELSVARQKIARWSKLILSPPLGRARCPSLVWHTFLKSATSSGCCIDHPSPPSLLRDVSDSGSTFGDASGPITRFEPMPSPEHLKPR